MDRVPNDVFKMVYRYLYNIVLKTLNVELCTVMQTQYVKCILTKDKSRNSWCRKSVLFQGQLVYIMYAEDCWYMAYDEVNKLGYRRISIINGNIYCFQRKSGNDIVSGKLVCRKNNISNRYNEFKQLEISSF